MGLADGLLWEVTDGGLTVTRARIWVRQGDRVGCSSAILGYCVRKIGKVLSVKSYSAVVHTHHI